MKKAKRLERIKTDLQIEEYLDYQERGYGIQKAGLFFIGAMVLLAAIGMFGDGVISKMVMSEGDVKVESERFYRHEAKMEMKVQLLGSDGIENTISFPNQYLTNFEVQSIVPEPKTNRVDGDKVHYSFEGAGNINVSFILIPHTVGKIKGSIDVNKHTFALNHFIFP
jgi:hypothetical protein